MSTIDSYLLLGYRYMPLTLKQHAYQVIREKLMTGAIQPGGRLSDDAFAKELGISRSPVREAISQLVSEGLIDHRPRSGAYLRVPDLRELDELYEARIALESFAAAKAAEQMCAADLKELDRINGKTRSTVVACRSFPNKIADQRLTDRFLSLDYEFHMLILRAAGNERVMKMVSDCKMMTRVFGHVPIDHDLTLLASTFGQHLRIARAIHRRDVDNAKFWMESHIRFARDAVLKGFRHEH